MAQILEIRSTLKWLSIDVWKLDCQLSVVANNFTYYWEIQFIRVIFKKSLSQVVDSSLAKVSYMSMSNFQGRKVHSHHNLEEELEYLESSYWPHPFW
jgi:hypothetical protein